MLAVQICELREFGHVVEGKITLYQVPGSGTYQWISAGPGGTLWIVSGTNLLVYSAAGVLTATYPVSSTTGDLTAPVLGADGRMWLADFTSRVLAVDASGHVSSYPCTGFCEGMIAGRNNELWGIGLTSDYAEFFYSVTSAGVVTEYGNPEGYLVAGPGQGLESVGGTQINAIDAKENVIPIASLKPLGLDQTIAVSASNANLWFVGTRDNEKRGVVGTISSKGAVHGENFAKPPCREAYVYFSALTQGGDGAMYGGFGCGDDTGTHAGYLARITSKG